MRLACARFLATFTGSLPPTNGTQSTSSAASSERAWGVSKVTQLYGGSMPSTLSFRWCSSFRCPRWRQPAGRSQLPVRGDQLAGVADVRPARGAEDDRVDVGL